MQNRDGHEGQVGRDRDFPSPEYSREVREGGISVTFSRAPGSFLPVSFPRLAAGFSRLFRRREGEAFSLVEKACYKEAVRCIGYKGVQAVAPMPTGKQAVT